MMITGNDKYILDELGDRLQGEFQLEEQPLPKIMMETLARLDAADQVPTKPTNGGGERN